MRALPSVVRMHILRSPLLVRFGGLFSISVSACLNERQQAVSQLGESAWAHRALRALPHRQQIVAAVNKHFLRRGVHRLEVGLSPLLAKEPHLTLLTCLRADPDSADLRLLERPSI